MTAPQVLRIIVADDHALVRGAVVALLNAQANWQVVGEAADGLEAIRLATSLHPDVAIIDWSMPVYSGLQVVSTLRKTSPTTRVVIYSRNRDRSYVEAAAKAGATGYVTKQSQGATLFDAIRTAALGLPFIDPSLAGNSCPPTRCDDVEPALPGCEQAMRG